MDLCLNPVIPNCMTLWIRKPSRLPLPAFSSLFNWAMSSHIKSKPFFKIPFLFKLIQLAWCISFRGRGQWLVRPAEPPVLVSAHALLHAHHPATPPATPAPPAALSLFPLIKSLFWIVSLSGFVSGFFLPSPMTLCSVASIPHVSEIIG